MPTNNGKKATGRGEFVPLIRCATLSLCLMVAFSVVGTGCAYFNTLYNAKKIYKEAQAVPKLEDGSVNQSVVRRYDEVIEKCSMLITTYPKSKYVDDAILLIGKCLYEQGKHDDALVKFDELKTNFPDSKLNREGQLYAAKSHIANGDLEDAVAILTALVEEKPQGKGTDEILFLLGTTLIEIGQEDNAVQYLEMLATQYKKSPYRVSADLDAARLYAERGDYEKSLVIYENLRTMRLNDEDTVKYLSRLAELHTNMGDYAKALEVFEELDQYILSANDKAANMLVQGRAYAGIDSLSRAIDTYRGVTLSYPRSKFSAEAYFRLGETYQDELDSLEVAKAQFDNVPAQYANSPFAEEAIARSVSISRLMRLRSSLEDGGEGDKAAVQFDLAEVQLLQFDNYQEALEGYRKILDDFPESVVAPKAAYAIAYIYDVHFKDPDKARAAYEYLIDRYPETQQAAYARKTLGLPPLPEREPIEGPPEPVEEEDGQGQESGQANDERQEQGQNEGEDQEQNKGEGQGQDESQGQDEGEERGQEKQ